MTSSSPTGMGFASGAQLPAGRRGPARRGHRDGRNQESRKSRRLCQRGDNPEVVRRPRSRRHPARRIGSGAGGIRPAAGDSKPAHARAASEPADRTAGARVRRAGEGAQAGRSGGARARRRSDGPGRGWARRSRAASRASARRRWRRCRWRTAACCWWARPPIRSPSSDWPRAAAAASALGALLDGAVPTALEEWEVPPDVVARACAALRALAWRSDAALADAPGGAGRGRGGGAQLRQRRGSGAAGARRHAGAAARGDAGRGRGGDERETVLRDGIADGDRERQRGGDGRGVPDRGAHRAERQDRAAARAGDRGGADDGGGADDAARGRGRDARLPGGGGNARGSRAAGRAAAPARHRRCAIAPSSSACGRRRESRDGGGDAGAGERARGQGGSAARGWPAARGGSAR